MIPHEYAHHACVSHPEGGFLHASFVKYVCRLTATSQVKVDCFVQSTLAIITRIHNSGYRPTCSYGLARPMSKQSCKQACNCFAAVRDFYSRYTIESRVESTTACPMRAWQIWHPSTVWMHPFAIKGLESQYTGNATPLPW